MAAILTSGSDAEVTIEWDDHPNLQPTMTGQIAWASSNPEIATVEPVPDKPLVGRVYSVGPIGPVQIHATAEVDYGDGAVLLQTATVDVNIIAGDYSRGTANLLAKRHVVTPLGEEAELDRG